MTEHLNEQPWYDYQECLSAAEQMDHSTNASIGEIFLCRLAAVDIEAAAKK